jgi:hypothetical protein
MKTPNGPLKTDRPYRDPDAKNPKHFRFGFCFHIGIYPLTAPAMKLAWILLLRRAYTIIVGSVAIVSAAPMGPQSVVY